MGGFDLYCCLCGCPFYTYNKDEERTKWLENIYYLNEDDEIVPNIVENFSNIYKKGEENKNSFQACSYHYNSKKWLRNSQPREEIKAYPYNSSTGEKNPYEINIPEENPKNIGRLIHVNCWNMVKQETGKELKFSDLYTEPDMLSNHDELKYSIDYYDIPMEQYAYCRYSEDYIKLGPKYGTKWEDNAWKYTDPLGDSNDSKKNKERIIKIPHNFINRKFFVTDLGNQYLNKLGLNTEKSLSSQIANSLKKHELFNYTTFILLFINQFIKNEEFNPMSINIENDALQIYSKTLGLFYSIQNCRTKIEEFNKYEGDDLDEISKILYKKNIKELNKKKCIQDIEDMIDKGLVGYEYNCE
jgi:hypothetical protein